MKFETCRFCKKCAYETAEGMVRYAVRHWAHWSCLFQHKGLEALEALTDFQLSKMPYRLVEDNPEIKQLAISVMSRLESVQNESSR